jgi:hypothetical protein
MQNHEMILCAALNEAHEERERASKIADDADIEVNILRQKCNEIARDLKDKIDACNERLSLDACSERGVLELQAALLISQAHHNEVIFSATRNSIWEEGDLNVGISNSKVESLIVDALLQCEHNAEEIKIAAHNAEIKISAFVECDNVETPLKNMNRGAGRLFDSVYILFTIHSLCQI